MSGTYINLAINLILLHYNVTSYGSVEVICPFPFVVNTEGTSNLDKTPLTDIQLGQFT